MSKISIETEIRWCKESISDLESIIEEDVPYSVYGFKNEKEVREHITTYQNKVDELNEKLKEVGNA